MAKNKNKNVESNVDNKEVATTTKTKDVKAKDAKAKDAKKAKKQKSDKKGVGQKSKELYSELKKVSWPSFGKVVKTTGVVILLVAICTLLLFGADRLFYWIFSLLMG